MIQIIAWRIHTKHPIAKPCNYLSEVWKNCCFCLSLYRWFSLIGSFSHFDWSQLCCFLWVRTLDLCLKPLESLVSHPTNRNTQKHWSHLMKSSVTKAQTTSRGHLRPLTYLFRWKLSELISKRSYFKLDTWIYCFEQINRDTTHIFSAPPERQIPKALIPMHWFVHYWVKQMAVAGNSNSLEKQWFPTLVLEYPCPA